MNISVLMDKISQVENPILRLVLFFLALCLGVIKGIYLFSLGVLEYCIVPLFNTLFGLAGLRIVIGKNQHGDTWQNNYMLAYKIAPWESFACYQNNYTSLFSLSY